MLSYRDESADLSPFGVEVKLSPGDLNNEQLLNELRDLFNRDGLLLVRGLRMDHEEQIRFCRNFGPVPDSPFENFLVSNLEEQGHLGTRELLWHNDVPYLPSPYLAASLHALRVDKAVTGTRFASGYRAYDRLPAPLKERISGLKALQVRERVWDRPNRLTDLESGDMCTVHSVVQRQRGTGRPFLFVNEDMTACIIGLSDQASAELLDELYSYLYVESEVYEHAWSAGDLVLWDNLAIQHARGRAGTGIRTLQRVTITELGYAEQYPSDTGIYSSLGNAEMLE